MGQTGQLKDENAAFHVYLESSIRLYRALAEAAEIVIRG
jgi:hypothetical protein